VVVVAAVVVAAVVEVLENLIRLLFRGAVDVALLQEAAVIHLLIQLTLMLHFGEG
jgi:hypothetical protein